MRPILKWTALSVVTLAVGFGAFVWIHDNTPLGCYVEEEYPPLKPGTPEYAAMQVAVPFLPKALNAELKDVRTYIRPLDETEWHDQAEKIERRDYWFISFHLRHKKSLFGCDQRHLDGGWTAQIRKRDLMVMNKPVY